MKKYVIGIDVGASKTLCGLFDEQMRLVRVIQRPTDAELTAEEMMDALDGYARELTRGAGVPLEEVRVPVQERKVLHDTVAALRLDSVLAVGFSISRSKASQLIASGRCAVNWQDTSKSDLAVRAGDVISCRGLGKCRLAEVGSLSRKGRINVTVERYL